MSPAGFRVLWPDVGLEGTMKHMAGRKRHSAEDIVRKLRRADELAAAGKTGEEVAGELGVSAATLYNWRRAYGGIDTDAAKELKELREQNSRLKRLLAEAELENRCGRSRRENSEPSCQAPRRGHAQDHVEHVRTVGVQSSWAGPLHLPPPPASADTVRSGCRDEGLAARLRDQTSLSWVPARLGGVALRRAP